MPPTIHCVRHAQGYHNLSTENHGMLDPLLTPHGVEQCLALRSAFPHHDKISLVVASPLKRTIQTAYYGFEPDIKRTNTKIITLAELQEISDMPCDTGSPIPEIEREFKDIPVDVSLLDPEWHTNKGRWEPTYRKIEARARAARKWLRERPEEHVVVVTHGGYLHYLTEDWYGADKFLGTGWANTEYRTYTFDPDSGDDAYMHETPESWHRREGNTQPLSPDERRNLKAAAYKTWTEQGLFLSIKNDIEVQA